MNKTKIKQFKKVLLAEKDKIIKKWNYDKKNKEDLVKPEIGDIVDESFKMYEKVRAIQFNEKEKDILTAIDNALNRIKLGSYGICFQCKKEINEERLKIIPWIPVCINCAKQISTKNGV